MSNALEAENKALREGLEFYAHPQNYVSRTGMYSPISKDGFGNRARALLTKEKAS